MPASNNTSSFIRADVFQNSSSKEHDSTTTSTELQQIFQKQLSKDSHFGDKIKTGHVSRKKTATNRSIMTRKSSISKPTRNNLTRFNTSNENLDLNTNDVIVTAIFEIPNTLSTKVGMCTINYNTGELTLAEFIDSQIFIRTIHKLQIYDPTVIVLPSTSTQSGSSKLATILKYNTRDCVKINEINVKNFNVEKGLQIIEKYSLISLNKIDKSEQLIENQFALKATSAAIKYITENIYKDAELRGKFKHFRINHEDPDGTMLIDYKTIKGLELIENNNDKNGLSLFKFLKRTVTKMGDRLLKNNILQPLTDPEVIHLRFDTVCTLIKQDELLLEIMNEMKNFEDLDKLFSKLLSINHCAIGPEQKINYILLLKESLCIVKKVFNLLSDDRVNTVLLDEIKKILNDEILTNIEGLINDKINSDCTWALTPFQLQQQRAYAVNCNANGLLGVSREIYRNLIDKITQDIEEMNNKYQLEISYSYDSKRDFFLKIAKNSIPHNSQLPEIFISKSNKKNHIECTTVDLLKANARLKEILNEIVYLSEYLVDELFRDIMKENISSLFMMSEAISMLDLLCSFAKISGNNRYVEPKFSELLYIKEARHPVLERFIESFIPNDIISLKESSSFNIMTGCNNSGKSVYLKQIPLLCIMAQIGCPIPAKSATLPIFRKLHARVCNDSMEVSTSTFSFEMKEMVYFLDNIDSDTLLIVDELGRGSSIGDGLAISMAVTEYLLNFDSIVFISTHFKELSSIFKTKPKIRHLHMMTEPDTKAPCYKLTLSADTFMHYALHNVKSMFPENIIAEAFRISELILRNKSEFKHRKVSSNDKVKLLNQMKEINNMVHLLRLLTSNAENKISLDSLKRIQFEYIDKLSHK